MPIGLQSVLSTGNLFQGYWSHVHFVKDPQAEDEDDRIKYYLGVFQDAVLEMSREDTEYLGTHFPRRVELLSPTRMGMKFSGRMDEMTAPNMHLLMGDDIADESQYLNPGANCAFDDVFGNLIARRKRCDGFIMEATLWKVTGNGAMSIGGDASVVGTNAEFNALDDTNAVYGGGPSSPLGKLYCPTPATSPIFTSES